MKLENVDLNKLHVGDLPKFERCPCELCDDGCFDRAGNKHYPQCRRRSPQRMKLSQSASCPVTHYQSTFLAGQSASDGNRNYRRKPCTPAPDNEIPVAFKNGSMSGLSSQRDHFQPPPLGIKPPASMAPTQDNNTILTARAVPMETRSHYQAEYVEKSVVPVKVHPLKDSQIYLSEPAASMNSQTTTRAHFKPWQSAPSHPYAEMPAVVGHVLFPGAQRHFDTTNASTFVSYQNVPKIKPAVRLEPSGNLSISGGLMDLQTNYRQDYILPDTTSIRKTATEKTQEAREPKVYTRRPMNGISQTSYDYRAYPKHRPAAPAQLETFQSQISLGNTFTPVSGDSQYRLDYPGHDTNQHPRQRPAMPKEEKKPYVSPLEKMDTVTITQRDYQPIDINSLPKIRLVPLKSSLTVADQSVPMESVTMSRYHFKPYEAPTARRQYGELIPNLYISPMEKFQSTTTAGESYQGRTGPRTRAFIPESESIHQTGEHDHRTNYRMDYPPHGVSLCAAKAFTIAQNKETTGAPIPAQ